MIDLLIIQEIIEQIFKVNSINKVSNRSTRKITAIRKIYVKFAKESTEHTYREIGIFIGLNYPYILKTYHQQANKMVNEPYYKNKYNRLETALNQA